MSSYIGCDDVLEIEGLTDDASGYVCAERTATQPNLTPVGTGVIQAQFPAVAINLYNDAPVGNRNRVLDPYRIVERDGVKVAVIGITAAIVPQQADVFNIGLRFTQGVEELPGILDQVKAEGAKIIVVQSELGLSQNIEIARRFNDIDVMYSAHTHEVTHGALLADESDVTRTEPGEQLSTDDLDRLMRGATIVVETNRDMYVGRLDLMLSGGNIVDFDWQNIAVDGAVYDEDIAMAKLVASIEEPFVEGKDGEVMRHTFMPGGFCTPPAPANCGDTTLRGLQLVDSLDTVVGKTDTLLLRHHVLEDTLNNFLADAIRDVTDPVVAGAGVNGWTGVDISMANGFRFGNAVLPNTDITLRDLYTWFPIAPAVNVAEFSGQALEKNLNEILGAVFHRNVFEQRGGWYLGLANMTQDIDLAHRPFSSSGGRIVRTTVGDMQLDTSKRYVFASCYAQGDAIDQVCRTGGGSGHMFFTLADVDDYNSNFGLTGPVNNTGIINGAVIKQVAPDNFMHPVHAVRRYLDSLTDREVTETQFSAPRVRLVDSRYPSNPSQSESEQIGQPDNTPDPSFVQPPFGAGPKFFSGRIGGDV
jgi:2',3'-cyclic-nucleotide 2'-phosphodiesterase (5'-nucleotidase family)